MLAVNMRLHPAVRDVVVTVVAESAVPSRAGVLLDEGMELLDGERHRGDPRHAGASFFGGFRLVVGGGFGLVGLGLVVGTVVGVGCGAVVGGLVVGCDGGTGSPPGWDGGGAQVVGERTGVPPPGS